MNSPAQLNESVKNLNPYKLALQQQKGQEKQALQKPAEQPVMDQTGSRAASALRWTVRSENGQLKIEALANTSDFDVTSISTFEETTDAPAVLKFAGYRIDLKAKITMYMENYVKNYGLTKSHNFMVARFAELKVAYYAFLLSVMGVSIDEIEKLKNKAVKEAIKQNRILCEENEYNAELLSIIGGSKKQMRRQQRIIKEIRKQLMLQAKQLGVEEEYQAENLLDLRIRQCQKILDKFNEEKFNLKYQLNCIGVN